MTRAQALARESCSIAAGGDLRNKSFTRSCRHEDRCARSQRICRNCRLLSNAGRAVSIRLSLEKAADKEGSNEIIGLTVYSPTIGAVRAVLRHPKPPVRLRRGSSRLEVPPQENTAWACSRPITRMKRGAFCRLIRQSWTLFDRFPRTIALA
jgi:hypothetical protein